MGLIDDCIECFSTKCFYEILKISKNAVDAQIKKSYRKISLQVHPDRASATEKELATTKFQVNNILFIPFFKFKVLTGVRTFKVTYKKKKKFCSLMTKK